MIRSSRILAFAVAFAAAAFGFVPPAAADLVEIGTLKCALSSPLGPSLPIVRPLGRLGVIRCIFDPINQAIADEEYRVTVIFPHPQALTDEHAHLVWKVFAGLRGTGLLAGGYAPASEGDPFEQQFGLPVLVGGAGNLIALKPEGQVVGHTIVAALITVLELQFLD